MVFYGLLNFVSWVLFVFETPRFRIALGTCGWTVIWFCFWVGMVRGWMVWNSVVWGGVVWGGMMGNSVVGSIRCRCVRCGGIRFRCIGFWVVIRSYWGIRGWLVMIRGWCRRIAVSWWGGGVSVWSMGSWVCSISIGISGDDSNQGRDDLESRRKKGRIKLEHWRKSDLRYRKTTR